jgi:uncharacterized protein YlxW (UPF0749 family)
MGASLLDAVYAETLDPAYAQAAAQRAQDGEPDAARRRSRRIARQLVAVTMVVAGFLLAVSYDEAEATVQGRQQVRAALVEDIHRESGVSDDLNSQLENLRAEVNRTRDRLLAASEVGQRALDKLAKAEQGAGLVAVTGPGLVVTLANAPQKADEDPVGGTADADPRGRVQDGDLQLVVNALWAAGAEGVSINGQRLGPTTAIRFAGEAVLVDFRPVTSPYEVSAIGDPDTLSRSFLDSPQVSDLALISDTFHLRFDLSRKDEVSLPAGNAPELRNAVPEGRDPAASVPDPTPGG